MEGPEFQRAVNIKRLKEEFVSNLDGTTMLEIAALSAVFPAFVILRQICGILIDSALKPGDGNKNTSAGKTNQDGHPEKGLRGFAPSLFLDFLLVVVPTVACLTVLADWTYYILFVVLCLTVAGVSGLKSMGLLSSELKQLREDKKEGSSRKPFLSSFRFIMMVVTCISILAVDFHVFPRRYAKTETYGSGLMDIGVGSFVVANGLVSRQARNLPPSKYGGIVRNTSPLLIVGFTRLALTKGVDYQEHVAEYGVHWNFFFTLAAVSILTSIIQVSASYCAVLGFFILTVYQTTLSLGLNEYLLSPNRGPGLISLNKEGIYSIVGYLGLYLISVQLGHYLCSERVHIKDSQVSHHDKGERKSPWWTAMNVWLLDGSLWLMATFLDKFIEKVSRRSCNVAYVFFVLAQNLEVIAVFLTADIILPAKKMLTLQIFDHNLLATFLWANILTGAVNMSMDTIFVPDGKALANLITYMALVVGGLSIFEVFGLRLKFW